MTYGVDAFQDDVMTTDIRGNSNVTTPGGLRTVSGGFVQLKQNYSTWLEVDQRDPLRHYDLESRDSRLPAATASRRRSPSA